MNYFSTKKNSLLIFLLSNILSSIALYLLSSPIQTIAMILSINFLLYIIYIVLDYKKYAKQYMSLLSIDSMKIENLSTPTNSIEKLYTDHLISQIEKYEILSQETSVIKDNLGDYYGAWYQLMSHTVSTLKTKIKNTGAIKEYTSDFIKLETYSDLVLKYLLIDTITSDEEYQTTDLKALVRSASRKYGQQIIDGNIKFTMTNCDKKIKTNELWFGFVIEQLLSNSLKYTNAGCVTIYSEGTKLYVQDTGIGISQEDLPNIFDHGFKGLNSDNDSVGLGLFLCKKVLRKLGHTITIESILDVGTTVCVDFSKK